MIWIRLSADGEEKQTAKLSQYKRSKITTQLRKWPWLTHRIEDPDFVDVSREAEGERGMGSRGQIVLLVDGCNDRGIIYKTSSDGFVVFFLSPSPRGVGSLWSKS